MVKNKNGFTFIEIMVTLIILSVGLVSILKSYIISLDQMSHLTNRLYATTILDNQISLIERTLRIEKKFPVSLEPIERMNAGGKKVIFQPNIKISEIADYVEIFKLDIDISWIEGRYQRKLSRSAYLRNIKEK